MLLTFRVKLQRIVDGRKLTTIRISTPTREKYWASHATELNEGMIDARQSIVNTWGESCHLWWTNPRNKSPYCRKIGKSPLLRVARAKGEYLSRVDAERDGFDSLDELYSALEFTNNMSREQIIEATWFIYTWDEYSLEREPLFIKHDINHCKEEFCPLCFESRNGGN